jgi:hypothetical protein
MSENIFSEIWRVRSEFCEESFFHKLKWSLVIWWRLRTECQHKRVEQKRWLDNDTPMAETWCLDCGFHDCGHVYADSKTWLS